MNRYHVKLFRYNHTHGDNADRERNAWNAVHLEPIADGDLEGSSIRDAAAFGYVLGHGLDAANKLRDLNAPTVMIRAEIDVAAIASSLIKAECWAGPCLLLDWNPFEVFYLVVEPIAEQEAAADWPPK